MTNIHSHEFAKAIKGLPKPAKKYPHTIQIFVLRVLSAMNPENNLRILDVASAIPSIKPNVLGPANNTEVR